MKFKLDTKIPAFDSKISYEKSLVFLGSCFSDELSAHFKNAGFNTIANPFGTIFHPEPLARIIENALTGNTDFHIFENQKRFYSWDASMLVSGSSKSELENYFRNIQMKLKNYLLNSSHLFITLGSAWGYELKGENYIVANCHKQNPSFFEKQLSELEMLLHSWNELIPKIQLLNPDLEIIFTISPVRHVKDGLIENNRSKARLLELLSILEKENPLKYFPSYEIVMDELRDYRFFKADFIHPNEQAISYIWEKIQETFFDDTTLKICREAEKLRLLDEHRVLSENEEEKKIFEENKRLKIASFLNENKHIVW